jgi:CheY-like chemotaxis protein
MDDAPRRVLLVAQSSTFRDQLLEAIVRDGYQVTCAGDGAEALTWLAQRPLPHAIVVDLVLPGASAIAFRKAQLQSPELRRVPTVALSVVRPLPGTDDVAFHAVVSKVTAVEQMVEVLALLSSRTDRIS